MTVQRCAQTSFACPVQSLGPKSQVVDHRIQTDFLNTLLLFIQSKTIPGGGDTTVKIT